MTTSPQDPIALEDRQSTGDRLYSPSAARNREAIAGILAARLPENARVLEIGSGTGEHAVQVCRARSDIRWQPSDPDATSRASQAAWASEAGGRMTPPLDIDLTRADACADLGRIDALVCINVIHISPWTVAKALAGLARSHLEPGGLVYLYGPYKEGTATAASNLDFDRSLRSRNPDWGVRNRSDVEALFRAAGLDGPERIEMPANNLSLIFTKPEAR
ncbi:DUF938 domain-containing protein [Maricaulis sp. CAU 1757]